MKKTEAPLFLGHAVIGNSLICLAMILFACVVASAQPGPPRGRRPPGDRGLVGQRHLRGPRGGQQGDNPFLLPKNGRIADIIGFQHMGSSDIEFDAVFYLPSSYDGLQRVTLDKIYYYPADADTAEILTDALGARLLHLKYPALKPREKVVVYYTGTIDEKQPEREVKGWKNQPVPPDAAAYPESVAVYLKPGKELESDSPAVREYARKIIPDKSGLTYGEAVCAAVEDIDAFSFGRATRLHTVFPPTKIQSAVEALASHKCTCVECARLACAVLRNANIPCRTATGFFGGKPWDHTWIQVYVRQIGWVDVDPQQGYCPDDLLNREYPGKFSLYELLDPDQNETYEIQFTTRPPTLMRVMVLQAGDFNEFIEQGSTRRKKSIGWGSISPR